MKKLSVWVLIMLLAVAFFVGAAAEDLIIEYDRAGEQSVAAGAMPDGGREETILSKAVDSIVPEVEDAPLPGGDTQDMPEYADNR